MLRYHAAESFFKNTEDTDYVFNLEKGEISRVIEVPTGWAIYRCDSEAVIPDFSSAEEIEEVRSYMNRFERGLIEDYFYNTAEEFIQDAEENGFESASFSRGKLYQKTDFFPVNYGNLGFQFYGTNYPVFQSITVNGSPSPVLQSGSWNVFFLSEIHALDENGISSPLILDENVVVMQCTGVRTVPEEELQSIDMIYPAAVQYWYEQDLSRVVQNSKAFEDNFNSEFTRLFLNQEQ